jgi:hypothetical protein
MQSALDAAMQSAEYAESFDLLGQMTGTFYSIAKSKGPIDFKYMFKGGTPAQRQELGDAGNFAYFAIGSGYLPNAELDAGTAYYGLKTAIFGSRPFSDLTGRMFSNSSAARVRDAALEPVS